MATFSGTSLAKLSSCDVKLQRIFSEVVKKYNCTVLEGHRSTSRQEMLFNTGQSKVRHSKHNEDPSLAIDICPYPIPDEWGDHNTLEKAKFYHFAGYVKAIAESMGVELRWGGDWDSDLDFDDQTFYDLVHFEIKE